jgi:NAD(P)-dependent dehydrogenase (short-subunit alcohol dehydrogenase family)
MTILEDRIALVTGGAQGLGAAICQRLAREGAHVVVADSSWSRRSDSHAGWRQETGRRARWPRCQRDRRGAGAGMVERTVAEFGRLDLVVANAGIVRSGPVDEMTLADWRW